MAQPPRPAETVLALRILWACLGLSVVEYGAMAVELLQTTAPEHLRFLLTGLGALSVAGGLVYGTLLVKVGNGRSWARVALAIWIVGWLAAQIYIWVDVGPTGWPLCVPNYGIPLLELFAVTKLFRGNGSSWFRSPGAPASAL